MTATSHEKGADPSVSECAHVLLEVTPIIIQSLRVEMRKMRLTDLSVPQFRTLAFINSNPGVSLSAVAEFIGLTLSSMSILVNGLVSRELVKRMTSAEDRRRVELTLTPSGRLVYTRALAGTEKRLESLLSGLESGERATVVNALTLLRPIFSPGTQEAPEPSLAGPEPKPPEGAAAPKRSRTPRAPSNALPDPQTGVTEK